MVLKVINLNKSYKNKTVLADVSFVLNKSDKVGLVGENGSGKSTLIKIIAELEKPDSGEVIFGKDVNFAYVPQKFGGEKVIDVLGELVNKSETLKLLGKLDLEKIDLDRRIDSLSGGQQSKIYLVKAFSNSSDLFLLDEPTNNLDFAGLGILENLIKQSGKSAFLIVSHDREFLDKTVSKIFEIDGFSHNLIIYDGNYSEYERIKELEEKKLRDSWEKQQREIRKLKRSIEEKRVWTNKAQKGPKITDSHKLGRGFAKDRSRNIARTMRAIETRLEKIKILEKPKEHWGLKFDIEESTRSGNIVVVIDSIEKSVGDFRLPKISLNIQRGERIAIVGKNGVGKTTLLNLLAGKVEPDGGEYKAGTNVITGFLEQINLDNGAEDIIDKFIEDTGVSMGEARGIIHKFGVRVGGSRKDIENLSPGERMRLSLAIFVTRGVNFLILDEPTNHLDIETIKELERVVRDFNGTLLLVSHDRRFMRNAGVDKIFTLDKEGLKEFKEEL